MLQLSQLLQQLQHEEKRQHSAHRRAGLISGGVFTSAQADAFEVPRYALSYAAKVGRIESPFQGAYRIAASPDDGYAELAALWRTNSTCRVTRKRLQTTWH